MSRLLQAAVIGALLLTATSIPTVAAAKKAGSSEKAKLRDISKLLTLTGANTLAEQMLGQMVTQWRQTFTQVPEAFWKTLMRKARTDDLLQHVAVAYAKHLTHNDVRALITFYSTPVGKKFVRVQPKLVQESMMAGQQWGQRLSEDVMKELRSKKYIE